MDALQRPSSSNWDEKKASSYRLKIVCAFAGCSGSDVRARATGKGRRPGPFVSVVGAFSEVVLPLSTSERVVVHLNFVSMLD